MHPIDDIRIFHKEMKSLIDGGYDVTLIGLPPQGSDIILISGNIIVLKVPLNKIFRIIISPWKVLVLGLKQQATIYHFHDPELIFVGLLLKLLGKKVIYDVHEDYGESILSKHYINRYLKNLLSFVFNFFEKISVPFFDLTFVATDHIKNKFSNDRVITVHNYPIIQTIPKKNEVSNSFKIIYPGPISRIRGIGNLLDAIGSLKSVNIELILIGEFVPSNYKEFLMKLYAWDQVLYKGVVSHEEVIISLASADLGIECSLPEPNYLHSESNKIFEYMSMGIPVLCSNLPRIKEIVEGNRCGICVDPNKQHEIANAILYLYQHPMLRDQMGENGRLAILSKYNWEIESLKLLKAYQSIF